VGVVDGGQTGPDVEELAYARLGGEMAHGPDQEASLEAGEQGDVRNIWTIISPASRSAA